MRKTATVIVATLVLLVSTLASTADANGFDQYGYNRTARNFVGPLSGWCAYKLAAPGCVGTDYEPYANDHLVMKWNAEWDRGNREGWAKPPYRAYLDNESNGNVPNGSGWTEHFKTAWVGPCADGGNLPPGAYCIWGQFAALMDMGKSPDHTSWWLAHAISNGYGSYP